MEWDSELEAALQDFDYFMASPRERELIAARRQIDTEIDGTRNVLSQLLVKRNEQSLINTLLPPEILGIIFVHAATDGKLSVSRPSRWLHITQVCVRWREIAQKLTPRLWSIVWAADTHPSLLHDMLARSGETPLQLIASSNPGVRSHDRCLANMALLMQQRERIRVVTVMGASVVPTVSFLNNHCQSGLTLNGVENLRLFYPAVPPNLAHTQPRPLILLGMSPYFIHLQNLSIIPHPALFRNLKAFHSREGLHWTLSQLTSALINMPQLEILGLSHPFRSPITSPDVYNDPSDRHVPLPQLRLLKFFGSDADSSVFFSRVGLPLHTKITVDVPTIVGLPLSPWIGRHIATLSVDFCPGRAFGLVMQYDTNLSAPNTMPGTGPMSSVRLSKYVQLQVRKSYSEMIGDVVGCFAACSFTGVQELSITLRSEPDTGHPGVRQLCQAVRTYFPSLQRLRVIGATSGQILDLVRTNEQEDKIPFPHLNTLVVTSPGLQKQEPKHKGTGTLNYFVKDLADCFYSRWTQHQAAALENLVINGERIDPAVLEFYAAYTCGTVNVNGDLGVPDVGHDMNALQTFLSLANQNL
ncbi:hypothetical protein EVG20_g6656 [Dentipellis fragilis]|uniref:Uncharacterized protein n=1 Tax=Dentipellis fragilis TaxID=205917 RepID=A0A4Y9YNK4_9AGAM|nr:hypothetical protein EVG20_g6656 [Dentipellis fragilis]